MAAEQAMFLTVAVWVWLSSFGGDAMQGTHRAAAEYLAEIVPNHPAARERLMAASGRFAAEAGILAGGEDLLGWNSPAGPDAARNAKAADLLERACGLYRAGVEELEEAVKALE